MDMRCIKFGETLPDMDEFKTAVKPLLDWVNEHCDPHETVIVEMGRAMLLRAEMGFTVDVPD